MRKAEIDLLTSDSCVDGHDITNKETSIVIRKRYGRQAGQTYYVCRKCDRKKARTYYQNRSSDTSELVRIVRANPQIARQLLRMASALIRK